MPHASAQGLVCQGTQALLTFCPCNMQLSLGWKLNGLCYVRPCLRKNERGGELPSFSLSGLLVGKLNILLVGLVLSHC